MTEGKRVIKQIKKKKREREKRIMEYISHQEKETSKKFLAMCKRRKTRAASCGTGTGPQPRGLKLE